jgi:hypothetical protein
LLGPPAEVEGSEHRNVDAESGKHQLDAAEHEGREGRACQIAEEIDEEDFIEANDADDHAPVCCQISFEAGDSGLEGWDTYAAPRAKHDMTAIFPVFLICSFQTDLIGKTKMKISVKMFVKMSDLSTRIWSMQ